MNGVDGAAALLEAMTERLASGDRFAGLFGSGAPTKGVTITGMLATSEDVELLDAELAPGAVRYPTMSREIKPAFWYERALHDLFGVVAENHPRLDPLILPHDEQYDPLPCPGASSSPDRVVPDERAIPQRVLGTGVFTIPHGPVRSGVFESVEYVIETPGEDIPHLNVRPYAKHRGVQNRFQDLSVHHGMLLAERVEGVASVAHALAYAHAVERLAGVTVPPAAALVRVVHAELERIANHLDVAMKLADAAGLAVAVARFGLHKERCLRLIGAMCGSRFGRGVVLPGGVTAVPRMPPAHLRARLDALAEGIRGDADALMDTPSFLDRLRGTGSLSHEQARVHGALGPVGRASGVYDDARWVRPYDAYPRLEPVVGDRRGGDDAMARLQVRWEEVNDSVALIRQATELLELAGGDSLRVPLRVPAGRAVGWAEAPQGEVLYVVAVNDDGRIERCAPRSASFHNLAVFASTFRGDVLTDFPFIEASFGLSIAGAVL
ncbi:NADH-quinone oxidoreductase subunit D [Sciscionella marina]|uniref:NADH-quinone oxidoreductase subunit D n=1 Tax=Sciscionella marina TaxID=508770 RepID=UPI000379C7EC|nr:NADH-quinone oxidoreductase subunit D [Sciscionella marina]